MLGIFSKIPIFPLAKIFFIPNINALKIKQNDFEKNDRRDFLRSNSRKSFFKWY